MLIVPYLVLLRAKVRNNLEYCSISPYLFIYIKPKAGEDALFCHPRPYDLRERLHLDSDLEFSIRVRSRSAKVKQVLPLLSLNHDLVSCAFNVLDGEDVIGSADLRLSGSHVLSEMSDYTPSLIFTTLLSSKPTVGFFAKGQSECGISNR